MEPPTPVSLFCSIGTHLTAVKYITQKYFVKNIVIVVSLYNKPEYVLKIQKLREDIKDITPVNAQLYELELSPVTFYESYKILLGYYYRMKDTVIITDITGGRKILSYLLYFTHYFSQLFLEEKSEIYYFFENQETPLRLPLLSIPTLSKKQIQILFDLKLKKEYQENGLTSKIKQLESNKFSKSTWYYCRNILLNEDLINNNNELTLKGLMFQEALKLSKNYIPM